jgi:uncharacterized protein YjeT (DUF2065 family)
MWHELLIALALVLVIEGVLPFLSPRGMRRAWAQMSSLDDRTLRIAGLVSMLGGALLLHFVR